MSSGEQQASTSMDGARARADQQASMTIASSRDPNLEMSKEDIGTYNCKTRYMRCTSKPTRQCNVVQK
jgi:hypothetical protein